jgi:DNA-binding response OmpR family regulator
MKRILFVEDEPAFAAAMIDRLESEGYRVEWTRTGAAACDIAHRQSFDLMVLDVMLPEKNGFDICRDLRRDGVRTPVLMLSARGEVVDRVLALKLGADDYVQKNFDPMELMARIEALIRRSSSPAAGPERAEFGAVRVDFRRHEVTRDGEPLTLSPVEFRFLEYMNGRRGEVVTREELLEKVWNLQGDTLSRTVDVHVAALRRRIEADPRYPRFLLTVKGSGYKLTF